MKNIRFFILSTMGTLALWLSAAYFIEPQEPARESSKSPELHQVSKTQKTTEQPSAKTPQNQKAPSNNTEVAKDS